MKRFIKKPSHLVIFSIVLFIFLTITTGILIKNKTEPQQIFPDDDLPTVHIVTIKRGTHPIKTRVFGTAQAEKTVTLKAAISGKIVDTSDLYIGKVIHPSDKLFSIEKNKTILAINTTEIQIRELNLKEQLFDQEVEILKSRITTAEKLKVIAKHASEKQQATLDIENKLFDNTQKLFKKENISATSLLNHEISLRRAEMSLLESSQNLQRSQDTLDQLQSLFVNTQYNRENLYNQKQLLKNRIDELKIDMDKSDIFVDFPAQIVKVHANSGEEVSPGTPLLTARSLDAVEIPLQLPDSYFRWLYEGTLITNPEKYNAIDIILVNRDLEKIFSNGFIKSIGESITIPTRSLPIIIGRNNPLKDDASTIPQEELKPGMYCKVLIELTNLDNVFIVPYAMLHANNNVIYYVDNGKLSSITDVEILFEADDGIIVRLPEEYQELDIVTHVVKNSIGTMVNATR